MSGLEPVSFGGTTAIGNSQEIRDRVMAKIDTDQNGRVSFEEIAATDRGEQVADKLRAFDTDGSGDLSAEELSQIQQHVAEKVREKAHMFSGIEPQALFEALFTEKDDIV